MLNKNRVSKEENNIIKPSTFKPQVKMKDDNFKQKIQDIEIKEEYKEKISEDKNLDYQEVFMIEAKKAQKEYFLKLSNLESIFLKQILTKFITGKDIKSCSLSVQNFIKNIPNNNKNLLKYFSVLNQLESQEILEKLSKYSKETNENKAIVQRVKENVSILFKAVQADYFVRFPN